jgi:hypothetical protein
MGLTVPSRRPLETIESLNDRGLEAIRTNFESLYNDVVVQSDSFALSAADLNTALAGYSDGYMKVSSGALVIQAAPIPVADGGTGASAFTAGSVVFAGPSGVYTQDNAHLFWDDSNNRLGIGTASPGSALTLDAATTDGPLITYRANAIDKWYMGTAHGALGGTFSASDFALYSLANTVLYQSNLYIPVGNVGIGTTAPKEGLDTRSATVISGDTVTGTNAYGTAHGLAISSVAGQARITAISNGANSVDINFRSLLTGAANNNQLFLQGSTSRVGINTASPSTTLHVLGSGDIARFSDGSHDFYVATDSGGGGMFTGAGETGSGVYLSALSSYVGFFVSGAEKGRVASTGFLTNVAGSAASPSFSYNGDSNTGVYFDASDGLLFATGGTLRVTVNTASVTSTLPWLGPNGAAATPALSASADTNTGIYFDAADGLLFTTGGTLRLTLNTTGLTNTLPFLGPNGTAGAPSHSASADTNTGIFFDGSDTIRFSTGGTERVVIGSGGSMSVTGQLQPANGSVGSPALCSSADTNTGLYFSGADTLLVSCGGTLVATFSTTTFTPATSITFGNVNAVFGGTGVIDFSGFVTAGTKTATLGSAGPMVTTTPAGWVAVKVAGAGTRYMPVWA